MDLNQRDRASKMYNICLHSVIIEVLLAMDKLAFWRQFFNILHGHLYSAHEVRIPQNCITLQMNRYVSLNFHESRAVPHTSFISNSCTKLVLRSYIFRPHSTELSLIE